MINVSMDRTSAGAAFALLMLAAACNASDDDAGSTDAGGSGNTGGSGESGAGGASDSDPAGAGGAQAATTPTVVSITPLDGATGVALNGSVSASFSEAMDPDTVTASEFTLTTGTASVLTEGTVVYAHSKAVFWPAAPLASNVEYTVTLDSQLASAAGAALQEYSWSFTTGDSVSPGLPVDLGAAGDYAVLAKSAISTVPSSSITGALALSPAAATYITGFSLTADATDAFSTSPQVTGKVYAADYASPTPASLTAAVGDMELAFTDAAARAADFTELGAGDIGGMTLSPGVYKWGTGLLIPTELTLDGSDTAVWLFQVAEDLTVSGGTELVLAGGALPENVFWQVGGQVVLGETAHFEGTILSQTAITLGTGASITGRLLAQTAVSLDSNTVSAPSL